MSLESMKKNGERYFARNDINATCRNARVPKMTLKLSGKENDLENIQMPNCLATPVLYGGVKYYGAKGR